VTAARKSLIHIDTTPYYHCVSRCVRRAFLCGNDQFSGRSYEHRKQWILDRVKQLSGVFAIDICAYAIMSNHYHLVLRVNNEDAGQWSSAEVMDRWCSLYKGPLLVKRYRAGESLSQAERNAVSDIVNEWRERLMDISWFMRCLNESVAREANIEDGCKGRFWEGRFKSQALLDETALLTCMMYVDLNLIRAGIHKTLFPPIENYAFAQLLPFASEHNQRKYTVPGIDFHQQDYFSLLDWTGRAIKQNKRGAIPSDIFPITKKSGRRFYRVIGAIEAVKKIGKQINAHWVKGLLQCGRLYKTDLDANSS